MYGSEAEFLQDQKEAEAEHHASLTGACRETFGADADRLGKPKRRGWRPRAQQDERAPGTPPSAQEVYDTVQRRPRTARRGPLWRRQLPGRRDHPGRVHGAGGAGVRRVGVHSGG